MELHEYPRPANDTGIGIHWTVGFATAIGMGKIRDFWLPELKAMGVKWVKIFNHDGAIDFAELLLAEGIMPIVRIYRPSPNPGTLDIRELVHLDAFIRAGVRYFEFNSEPDLDAEWKGGRVPANGLDLVIDNTIANMELILERGGMPGIPAVSNGSRWDIVGGIVGRGRKDLFNGPVWQAIHNFSRNRPLDYPYDIGNQEGAAYTQRFYEALANEQWGDDAWRGRRLQQVNRLRYERSNPGATIMDDNACWLAYEFFDARNRRHLGRSIPILSTECGYIVGEDSDPRYPATTPDLHMAQTLEACRVMMGTSNRYQTAPDYYFCSAYWLIGNAALGSAGNWCEHHAWYSDHWHGGALPIVRALKAEPKSVRRWQGDVPVGARAMLHGTVQNAGDRRTIILERNGSEVARTTLDANSRYLIPDLLSGNYTLRVEGTAIDQPVSLLPGQEDAVVNLDLAESFALSGSTLRGTVRGGAGAVVLLLRTNDGEEWVTMARDDGSFRFVDLPPGAYNVRVQGEGSHLAGILLDGKNQRDVELAVAGWGYTLRVQETSAQRGGYIRCLTPDHPGLTIRAHRADGDEWVGEPVQTRVISELNSAGCEIGPLEPGYYRVEVEGLTELDGTPCTLEAYVDVERRTLPVLEFVFTALEQMTADLHNSTVRGRVIGGCTPQRQLVARLIDDQAQRQEQPLTGDCTFLFEGLRPGLYTVEIAGYEDIASRADIALDGKNTVSIELLVPIEERFIRARRSDSGISIIAGTAPDSAGRTAKLVDAVGNEHRRVVDRRNRFRFENLPRGAYRLSVDGGYVYDEVVVDGSNGVFVTFQPLVEAWEAKVSPAGSMPGYSVVRVEVEGMRGLPVYIWKEDWEGMMRRTGSKPEYGDHAAEFSPLGPGHYMVEPEGLGVCADVELTGLEVFWIDFRRKGIPSSPHKLQPLEDVADALDAEEHTVDADTAPSDAAFRDAEHEPIFDDEPYRDEYGDEDAAPHADSPYRNGHWAMRQPDTPHPVEDEPVFDDSSVQDDAQQYAQQYNAQQDDVHHDAAQQGDSPQEMTGRAAEGDDDSWLRSYSASYEAMPEISLPSIGGRFDEDDDDTFAADDAFAAEDTWTEDAWTENTEDASDDTVRDTVREHTRQEQESPEDTVEHNDSNQAGSTPDNPPHLNDIHAEEPAPPPAQTDPVTPSEHRLCLLIPTPITDMDEMTALLQFVATARPAMAHTVAEVPDHSYVLLIGTSDTEDWPTIEQELRERNLSFERVNRSLVEVFGKGSNIDL